MFKSIRLNSELFLNTSNTSRSQGADTAEPAAVLDSKAEPSPMANQSQDTSTL